MKWVGSSRTKINKVTVESCFLLLLEVVNVFKVLEFIEA
jgi:hypothetical protein